MSDLKIKDFAFKNALKVCPVEYANKNYIAVKGWKSLTYESTHALKRNIDCYGYLVNIDSNENNKYIVLDTDDERAYIHVKKIIDKYELNEVSTPSNSCIYKKIEYKQHFWFKLPKELNSKKLSKKQYTDDTTDEKQLNLYERFGKLDVITGDIAEHEDTTINEDLISEIPKEYLKEHYLELQDKPKASKKPIKESEQADTKNILSTDELNDDLITILDNLSIGRFDNMNDWLTIAMIFINENYDLEIFNKYSKKSAKYDEAGNKKIISSLKKNENGYRKSTLYYFLKEDSPSVFNELMQKNNEIWETMKNLDHENVASLFYNKYSKKYIYKNKSWYIKNEYNIFKCYDDKAVSTSILSVDVCEFIKNLIKELLETTKNKNLIEVLNKGYKKVGYTSFLKGVCDILIKYYNNQDIKFNNNNDLLAFDNGLFDVTTGLFRDIEPEDYITITTKYNYPKVKDEKIYNEIKELIYSIFEDKEICEYWSKTIAMSFFGKNYQSFYLHTGVGRNGKGILHNLISNSLGEYHYTADPLLLTRERQSETNSTLANCEYVRFLSLSEPDNTGDYKLKTALVKSLTGGEKITARDLNKPNITYLPKFSVFVQCNKKPALNEVNKAIEERIKVVHYPLVFVDEPIKENERKRDNFLNEKLKDQKYINHFMLYMLEVARATYKEKSLIMPKKVKENNQEYLDDNNPVKRFINDFYEITDDPKDCIKASDFYNSYNLNDDYEPLGTVKFAEMCLANMLIRKKKKDANYYIGIKAK